MQLHQRLVEHLHPLLPLLAALRIDVVRPRGGLDLEYVLLLAVLHGPDVPGVLERYGPFRLGAGVFVAAEVC